MSKKHKESAKMRFWPLIIFAWIGISPGAWAFTFTPMAMSLQTSGPGSSQAFNLDNSSQESIAVELSLAGREMDLDGTERQVPIPEQDAKFTLYPQQLVMKPGERRTVRITWTGSAQLDREVAYRIIAEQLPVQAEKPLAPKGSFIKMLVKYVGSLYVTPVGASPKLELVRADHVPGKEPKLSLVFDNSKGTAHRLLTGLTLKISSGSDSGQSRSLTLGPSALPEVNGQNVLAGTSRRFLIAWPSGLPTGPVKVDFELQD